MAATDKLICLGGSFNPVHYGHLRCAQAAAKALGAEYAALIPSGVSPHKRTEGALAPAEDRLEMCRLAVSEMPGLVVNDWEVRNTGPSFTILTVRHLKQLGVKEVIWLVGADWVSGLPTWREAIALLNEARMTIMQRPGYEIDWSKLPPDFAKLRDSTVLVPQIDVSASEIRRRVRAGQSIEGLTPPAVCQFIRERRLYADG